MLRNGILVIRKHGPGARHRTVAKKVIELAQAGVRDPYRLKSLTIEAFQERTF